MQILNRFTRNVITEGEIYGPQLEKALWKIINADDSKAQQQAIMDARTIIK